MRPTVAPESTREDEDAEGDAAADIFIPKAVTELLKHHWGSNASFRDLHFYRAPATSKETVEISQGALVSEVIDQCERAEAEEEFRDIFITAPTGAGKTRTAMQDNERYVRSSSRPCHR